jgi:HlyD family secretion protein
MAPQAVSSTPVPERVALLAARPRRRWPLLVAGALVLGAAIAAYLIVAAQRASHPAPAAAATPALTVTIVPVARHAIADTLLVTGTLVPWEDLAIGTEASGLTVTQVLVEEGDTVAAGQLLAKLDDALIQAQLKQKQAQIDRAKAVIGQQEAGIGDAEASERSASSDLQRARELIKSANISVQTTEAREAAAATATAHVQTARMGKQIAESDVALAEAELAELKARLAQTEIRAPTAGIVAKRLVRVGRVVNAGDQLFEIVRDGILELDAEIPDRLLAQVKPGQQARLSVPGADGVTIIAPVRAVAPVVDAATRNGIAHIRAPADPRLKGGMFVSGELTLGQTEQLAVPESAVLTKDGSALVFVVDGQNHVAQRKIETGLRSDGLVAIKGGLELQDRVVDQGAGFLTDGDLVRIVETAQ